MRAVRDKFAKGRGGKRAFTIIEMLVATAVFMLMVVLLVSVVSQVNSVWQQTDGQKSRRQSARALLDLISRDLQAALGPIDAGNYSKFQFDLNPGAVGSIRSSLFWMAASPGSRNGTDIITVGYFVRRTATGSILCRVQQSGAVPSLWTMADTLAPANASSNYAGLAAENVLAMFVTLYKKTGGVESLPDQVYSGSALPYSVEVALVISDPRTAERLIGNLGSADAATVADDFVNALDAKYRSGVQVYRTRVDIPQAR